MRLIIDKEGGVILPQPVRQGLRLEPGDALEMESTMGHITLRPVREASSLTRQQGVWVLNTGEPIAAPTTDELLQHIREERDFANIG